MKSHVVCKKARGVGRHLRETETKMEQDHRGDGKNLRTQVEPVRYL